MSDGWPNRSAAFKHNTALQYCLTLQVIIFAPRTCLQGPSDCVSETLGRYVVRQFCHSLRGKGRHSLCANVHTDECKCQGRTGRTRVAHASHPQSRFDVCVRPYCYCDVRWPRDRSHALIQLLLACIGETVEMRCISTSLTLSGCIFI